MCELLYQEGSIDGVEGLVQVKKKGILRGSISDWDLQSSVGYCFLNRDGDEFADVNDVVHGRVAFSETSLRIVKGENPLLKL